LATLPAAFVRDSFSRFSREITPPGARMASPIDPFLTSTRIAYFSMEMAIRPEMHTYSGGLGGLAGDTARSSADLELPMVFVTLLNRAGYFRQSIGADGDQVEEPDWWEPAAWCSPLDVMIAVLIEHRPVWIRPWLYIHASNHGHRIPILLWIPASTRMAKATAS
jgi:starch phosphorylase